MVAPPRSHNNSAATRRSGTACPHETWSGLWPTSFAPTTAVPKSSTLASRATWELMCYLSMLAETTGLFRSNGEERQTRLKGLIPSKGYLAHLPLRVSCGGSSSPPLGGSLDRFLSRGQEPSGAGSQSSCSTAENSTECSVRFYRCGRGSG